MKNFSQIANKETSVSEAKAGKFKMYYIWIEGGGTPMFVLSAEDENEAWESANAFYNMWRKEGKKDQNIGYKRITNPVSDVRELPGVFSEMPVCYNLHQDGKGKLKNFGAAN